MLFKYSTKVLHIYKTGFHRDLQHTIPLFQEDCSLLQTYQTHKILRTLTRKSLQPSIEKRSAHRHLSTESVDIKVCVAQMSQHQTGSFIYKSLVLRIQNSFCHIFECLTLLIQDRIILFSSEAPVGSKCSLEESEPTICPEEADSEATSPLTRARLLSI